MEGKEDLKCVKPEACPWKIVLVIGRVNLKEEDSVPAQNKFFFVRNMLGNAASATINAPDSSVQMVLKIRNS